MNDNDGQQPANVRTLYLIQVTNGAHLLVAAPVHRSNCLIVNFPV